MSYGGFYTRQEQEDVMTAQITNPNRVGSGYINLGPQVRNPQMAQNANWQMGGGGPSRGAAPQGVSDIWATAKNPPPPQPPMQQHRPPPPQMPQMPPMPRAPPQAQQPFGARSGATPFAAPPPGDPTAQVNGLFNTFSVSAPPAPGTSAHGVPPNAPPGFPSMPPNLAQPAPPGQQPFLNGSAAAPPPPASLMGMLGNPPPPPAPGLAGFAGGLGNGVPSNNRHAAAFAPPMPQMPPMPQPSSYGSAPPGAGFGGAPPPSHRGGAPNAGGPPQHPGAGHMSARAAPPPKTLSSAADYGAAAAAWKPPTASTATSAVSVARKPEAAAAAKLPSATTAATAARQEATVAEWECLRCTFLNNGSLWECEMCGFDRPGKVEEQAAAQVAQASHRSNTAAPQAAAPPSEDAGWQTASKARPQPGGASQTAGGGAGKSKAQAKNEKRRAKKRTDGSFE